FEPLPLPDLIRLGVPGEQQNLLRRASPKHHCKRRLPCEQDIEARTGFGRFHLRLRMRCSTSSRNVVRSRRSAKSSGSAKLGPNSSSIAMIHSTRSSESPEGTGSSLFHHPSTSASVVSGVRRFTFAPTTRAIE